LKEWEPRVQISFAKKGAISGGSNGNGYSEVLYNKEPGKIANHVSAR